MPKWLKDWLAPGILLTVLGIATAMVNVRFTMIDTQYADVTKRLTELDSKLDRRADGILQNVRDTNARIDAILQQQTTLASQLARLEAEQAYIKGRLDRVADKLQVSAVSPTNSPQSPVPMAYSNDPLQITDILKLYEAIKNQPDPAFTKRTFSVGEQLPSSVPTKALPAAAATIRPEWSNLNYSVGDTGIAIIDPAANRVVNVVRFPFMPGSTTGSQFPPK